MKLKVAVDPYVYRYAPNGKLLGFQVRFKRQHQRRVESISAYFSISGCGTEQAALRAAIKWRDQNAQWVTDRAFIPRMVTRNR